jgi:hypothetical protein
VKTFGVPVANRAELERYLRENPMQLRATRTPRPPRPTDEDFIGPNSPELLNRLGSINRDADRCACFTIQKEPWERERDEKLLRKFGTL